MTPLKYTHPLSHYTELYHVSLSTIKRWSAQNVNLDNPDEVELHLCGQKHQPDNFTSRPDKPDKADKAEEAVKALAHHQELFQNTLKLIIERPQVSGLTAEQSKIGHLNLIKHMTLRFWKHTVRAFAGEKFEDFKDQDSE